MTSHSIRYLINEERPTQAMASREQRPDVAVFIDFENVYVSVRDKLDANPNFEMIMDRCEDLGRVVIARAYADWYRYPRVTSALYANGVEPMYVPTYYYDRDLGRTGRAIKNSVDMNLCIDAMKTLYTNPNIEKFVLCTGDRDFIPLVNSIRQQGKEVIIIGIGGAASSHLAQSADEFIFYETLVGKKPADLQNDQPKARMPEKTREPEYETPANGRDTSPPVREAVPAREAQQEDIYAVLVRAIHLARERDFVCSFGSLKLLMKELMGGEFREDKYRDGSGKPFAKFKDFVMEAERRGKVIVFTSGAMNEVFLPGEDPYKLSRFAIDLKEEPEVSSPVTSPEEITLKDRPSVSNRRRRRRSRNAKPQHETALTLDLNGSANDESDDFDSAFAELQEEDAPVDASEDRFEDLLERLDEEQAHVEELDTIVIAPVIHEASMPEQESEHIFEDTLALVTEESAFDQDAPSASVSYDISQEDSAPDMAYIQESSDIHDGPAVSETYDPPIVAFREEEWQALRDILSRSNRALSFMQIHDLLRGERNNAGLQRTNEELRTMIKQAINSGLLARSGKGNRVAYRLTMTDDMAEITATLDATEPAESEEAVWQSSPSANSTEGAWESPAMPWEISADQASEAPAEEGAAYELAEARAEVPTQEASVLKLAELTNEAQIEAPAKAAKPARNRRKKSATTDTPAAKQGKKSAGVDALAPLEATVETIVAEVAAPTKPARRRRPAKKTEEQG